MPNDQDIAMQEALRKPCKWWWRWFCKAPLSPGYHSWECLTCGKVFHD